MKPAYTLTALTAVLSAMMALPGVAAAQTAPVAATPAADACPTGWVRSDDGDCDPPKGEVLGFSIAGLNNPAVAAASTPVAAPAGAKTLVSTLMTPATQRSGHHRSYAAAHSASLASSQTLTRGGDEILATFALGSTKAGSTAEDHVHSFVSHLGTSLSGKHFIINGHTDARGSRRLNLRLSRRRAEAIKAMLIRAGLTQADVEVRAHGYDHLLRPRNPYAAANRRVDVVIVQN